MSMLRSVLTYMGLGPDEDYDDGYLYEADRRSSSRRPRVEKPDDATIDLRDGADDPHAQRRRPSWMEAVDTDEPEVELPDALGEHDDGVDIDELLDDGVSVAPLPEEEIEPLEEAAARGRHDADRRGDGGRSLRAVPSEPEADRMDDGVRVRSGRAGDGRRGPASGGRSRQATILAPRSFGDAKVLADEFKSKTPLVMNLQDVDRELARRLIDFASGICYALDGGMEKLAPQVFLLVPDQVEVSDEERRRLEQLGFGR
ncbi:MAG: cell division protein SepF [Actinomycetota bacterium]